MFKCDGGGYDGVFLQHSADPRTNGYRVNLAGTDILFTPAELSQIMYEHFGKPDMAISTLLKKQEYFQTAVDQSSPEPNINEYEGITGVPICNMIRANFVNLDIIDAIKP